jgi:hypothetical protein
VVHCVIFEVDAGCDPAGVEAAGTVDLEALVFEVPALPVAEETDFGPPVLTALDLVVVGEVA